MLLSCEAVRSFIPAGELTQAFVPELQVLREGSGDPTIVQSQQVEVFATFYVSLEADAAAIFGVNVDVSEDGSEFQVGSMHMPRTC